MSNSQEHNIGPPGTGKTFFGRTWAVERANRGIWTFVHDPGREFVRSGFVHYPSPQAWEEAARKATRDRAELRYGASIGGLDAGPLIDMCMALGDKHNRTAFGMGGAAPFPMALLINESTLVQGSGRTFISKRESILISQRRHYGIELCFNQQDLAQFPVTIYRGATLVRLFNQCGTEEDLAAFEKKCNLPKGSLVSKVPTLFLPDREGNPAHRNLPAEFIAIRPGWGFV